MKNLNFVKYNATGNDFIVIDNRKLEFKAEDIELWKRVCALKFGVGADGVLLLESSDKADFKMRYINADGGEVEMCGNGARTITAFAHAVLNLNKQTYQFETMNGIYQCSLDQEYGFRLKMTELFDVNQIDLSKFSPQINFTHSLYLNTGVPHAVFEINDILNFDVVNKGRLIRNDTAFIKGTNANFYESIGANHLRIRTYERGVENETLSCGTGATATAIAAAKKYGWTDKIILETLGGQLIVRFNADFSEVFLCGKVEKIFQGSIEL